MMIERNSSTIFNNRAMGMEEQDNYEPEDITVSSYDDKQRRLLQAIQPINFNEKVMGGQNSAYFLNGKLPEIGGSLAFTQKVNMLTGKGATMEEKDNSSLLGGNNGATFDINKILGSTKSSNFENMLSGHTGKSDKISEMLGLSSKTKSSKTKSLNFENMLGNSSSDKITKMLGTGIKTHKNIINPANKISQMLTGTPSKQSFKFDMKTGFGNRAFAGLDVNKKIHNSFGLGLNKIKNNNVNVKDSAMNKINSSFGIMGSKPNFNMNNKLNFNTSMGSNFMNTKTKDSNIKSLFGTFGNPEKTARTRIKQQKGLPMFGDFDGDRVLNMFDCNPLNPLLQGESHIPSNYVGGNSLAVQNKQIATQPVHEIFGADGRQIIPDITDMKEAEVIDMGEDVKSGEYIYNNENAKDNIVFDGLDLNARIKFAQDGFKNAASGDKKRYGDLLVNLMKQGPNAAEQEKTARAESKELFDREKWKYDKTKEQAIAKAKENIAEKTLGFEKQKFMASKKAGKVSSVFGQELALMNLDRSIQSENIKNAAVERSEARSFNLEKEKLRMQKGKQDMALWETKLRAGENLLGTLVGGGKPIDFGAKVGSGGTNLARDPRGLIGGGSGANVMNPAMLTGTGANDYHMMSLVGATTPSESFNSKVMASVGSPQNKSFAQKIGESLSRKKPEELIKEEQMARVEQMEAQMMQPQQVVQRPIQPRPVYQQPQFQQIRQPMQMQQPAQNINWGNVSPQQASQVDSSYAKYMQESTAEGFDGYRRGPYKKRQYR